MLDPRTHACRPDLADISLSSAVTAARYVEPRLKQCVQGVVPLFKSPALDAPLVSQIRYGEFVDVFEERTDGWAWVQNRSDRYVGYIRSTEVFSEQIAMLSSRVSALWTYLYAAPDIKTPPVDELTLGSYVSLGERAGRFWELTNGGFLFADHVTTSTAITTPDYVFTAGRLLHIPYLWGGRTPRGIDCSGLVQLALDIAGFDCPRDSDQQREAFGQPIDRHWRDLAMQRGDLVFFPGHVGIMAGTDHLLHASGHHMQVVVEPLINAVEARGNDFTAVGRPR